MSTTADNICVNTYFQKQFLFPYLANVFVMAAFSLSFCYAQYMRSLGFDDQSTGLAVSLAVFCGIAAKVALGRYGYQLGIKRFWLMGLAAFALGNGLILMEDTTLAVVGRMALVSGYAVAIACGISYIQIVSAPRRRTETLSVYSSSVFLGMLLGPAAIDSFHGAYHQLFGVAACLAVVAWLLLLFVPFESSRIPPNSHQLTPLRQLSSTWLGLTAMVMGGSFLMVQLFVMRFALTHGLTSTSVFFVSYALTAFIARLTGRHLAASFGRLPVIFAGLLAYSLAQFSFLGVDTSLLLAVPGVLTGIGRALLEPSLITIAVDRVSIKNRASGTAAISILIDIGLVLCAPFFGWIADGYGFETLFTVSGVLLLLPLAPCALTMMIAGRDGLIGTTSPINPHQEKLLITGEVHPMLLAELSRKSRFQIAYLPNISRAELLAEVADASYLICRIETEVDQELIDHATQLKIVGTATSGVNHIDVDALQAKNIHYFNCPGANAESVAEFTIASLLATMRQIPQAQKSLMKGEWHRTRFSGQLLRNKRVALLGYGEIGSRVARLYKEFGASVHIYDPAANKISVEALGYSYFSSIEAACRDCHVLSVHVPLTLKTHRFIDTRVFEMLADQATLVNTSRGEVIDENDLLAALNSSRLAGAAIDTWNNEPKINFQLARHPKVVGTPHIASLTDDAAYDVAQVLLRRFDDLSDRRDHQRLLLRHPLIVEISEKGIAHADNLSTEGCRIQTSAEIAPGTLLKLQFADFLIPAIVRWSDRDAQLNYIYGVEFRLPLSDQMLAQQLIASDRRFAQRIEPGHLVAKIGDQTHALAFDVSTTGIGLVTKDAYVVGHTLQISFDGETYDCEVVWCAKIHDFEYKVGFNFLRSLRQLS